MSRTLAGLDEDTVNAARDRKIGLLEGDIRSMRLTIDRLKKQVEDLAPAAKGRDFIGDALLVSYGQWKSRRNDVKHPFGADEILSSWGSFRQSGIKA